MECVCPRLRKLVPVAGGEAILVPDRSLRPDLLGVGNANVAVRSLSEYLGDEHHDKPVLVQKAR